MGVRDDRLEQPDVILKVNLEVIAADPADAANAPFRASSMSNEVALLMCHLTPACCLRCEGLLGAPTVGACLPESSIIHPSASLRLAADELKARSRHLL